mmetsp:Transcript_13417/g.31756  ORF Transcript_13417/g.31756 Transcript_13417/m.31756 type:complete len:208 (-) Transcript_13417:234-857(-)
MLWAARQELPLAVGVGGKLQARVQVALEVGVRVREAVGEEVLVAGVVELEEEGKAVALLPRDLPVDHVGRGEALPGRPLLRPHQRGHPVPVARLALGHVRHHEEGLLALARVSNREVKPEPVALVVRVAPNPELPLMLGDFRRALQVSALKVGVEDQVPFCARGRGAGGRHGAGLGGRWGNGLGIRVDGEFSSRDPWINFRTVHHMR